MALDMIDEARSWGVDFPLVLTDAGYGDTTAFRLGLEERELAYAVGISSRHPGGAVAAPGGLFAGSTESPGKTPRSRLMLWAWQTIRCAVGCS